MQQVNSQGFGSVMGKWIPNWEGIQMPQASPQSAEVKVQPRTFLHGLTHHGLGLCHVTPVSSPCTLIFPVTC